MVDRGSYYYTNGSGLRVSSTVNILVLLEFFQQMWNEFSVFGGVENLLLDLRGGLDEVFVLGPLHV